MEGIDYSKQLGKKTEDFYNRLDKNREATKRDTDRLEKTHEINETKQKAAAEKQLRGVEKEFTDRIETITDKAKNRILEKQKISDERNKQTGENFVKEKEQNLAEFNREINNLRKSYENRDRDTNEHYDRHMKSAGELNKEKMAGLNARHEKEVVQVLDKTKVDSDKFRSYSNEKKNQMAKNFRDQNEVVAHKESLDRSRDQKEMQREIRSNREAAESTIAHTNKRSKENYDRIQNEKNATNAQMSENFLDQSRKQNMAHATDTNEILQSAKDHTLELEKRHNKEKTDATTEFRRQSGGDEYGKMHKDNEMLRNKEVVHHQRAEHSKNISEMNEQFNDQVDVLKEKNRVANRETAISNAKNIENRDKHASLMATEERKKTHKTKSDLIDAYSEREKINKESFIDTLEKEGGTAEKKYQNLKQNFYSTVNDITDKSRQAYDDIRNIESQRRKDIVEQNRTQTNQTVFLMKKGNDDKMNRLTTDYEKRLNDAYQKMNELKTMYEDKIGHIRQEAANTLDKQIYVASEQRKQDTHDLLSQMAVKQEESDNTINSWRERYNKDMSKLSQDYERKMKSMINDYEGSISRLHTDRDRDKNIMMTEFNQQMERMRLGGKNEKDRLISQYENTISKLHEAFENKSNQIEEYKRSMAKESLTQQEKNKKA